MKGRVILASLVLAAAWLPAIAQAQSVEAAAVAAAPAPRLIFSEREMALARAVARQPGLADFYGRNDLRTVFSGPEGQARRQALLTAINRAAEHGLPPARYEPARLREFDRQGGDSPEAELAFARVFARWSHDVGGGRS